MHFHKKIKLGICLALIATMAACGGSGGTGSAADGPDIAPKGQPKKKATPPALLEKKPEIVPEEKPKIDLPKPAPKVELPNPVPKVETSKPVPKGEVPQPVPTVTSTDKPVMPSEILPAKKPEAKSGGAREVSPGGLTEVPPSEVTAVQVSQKKPVLPPEVIPEPKLDIPIGSYSDFVNREAAMIERYYTKGPMLQRNITSIDNMPVHSSATYKGIVGFGDDPDTTLGTKNDPDNDILFDDNLRNPTTVVTENGTKTVKASPPMLSGEITLNANFSENTFDGSVEKFKNYKNEDVSGALQLRTGQIEGNGFKNLSGDAIFGAIEFDGELREIVGGSYNGAFLGDNGQAVEGGIELLRDRGEGLSPGRVLGTFIAESSDQ